MRPQTILTSGLIAFVFLAAAPSGSASTAPSCNASTWDRVYDPSRLQVLSACITATGVIEESSADEDGDQHFLIKLDPGQDALLRKKNWRKKTGNLVGEVVCANSTTKKKARKVCAGYTNRITVPAIGAHVRVTGSHVLDTHNGWTEIHPVSQIQVI